MRQLSTLAVWASAMVAAFGGAELANAQATFAVRVRGGGGFDYGRGTVTSEPAGIDCTFLGKEAELVGAGTCTANFAAGTTVVLSVSTKDGTTHTGWLGDCSAFTGDCTLLVDRDRLATVVLKPAMHKVTIVLTGNGTGALVETVNFSTIGRLDCLISKGQVTGTCTADYPFGSRVFLEDRRPLNSFETLVGGPLQQVVSGPLTLSFAIQALEVGVVGAGTGSGRVVGVNGGGLTRLDCTVSPAGPTGDCVRLYDTTPAQLLSFTPTPSEGSIFVGWSGLCTGAGACSTLGDFPPNTRLVARFDAQPEGILSLFLNSTGGFGRGRVTSHPPGIDCDFSNPASTAGTGTCRADFAVGTPVQLTAVTRDGTRPLGFAGDCVSTSATCSLVMYHDRRVTVQLDPARFPVTVTATGNGSGSVNDFTNPASGGPFSPLRCQVTRGIAGSGCSALYPFGAPLDLSLGQSGRSEVTIDQTTCVTSACTVTGPLTFNTTFTAPEINIVGAGTGSGRIVGTGGAALNCTITPAGVSGTCSMSFDMIPGATVNFTAIPDAGSVFAGYSGLCTGIQACSTSGDVPPNDKLVARFDVATSTAGRLTVSGAGNGSGTVQSAPAGLTCNIVGGVAGAQCAAVFSLGTTVSLTPVASAGSRFVGWEGDCSGSSTCLVTVVDARFAVARFTQDASAIALTIAGGGTGNGVITVLPGGAHCGMTGVVVTGVGCAMTFSHPVDITLTAEPQAGSAFGGWAGACDNAEPTCSFTLTSSRTVTANFAAPHSSQDLTQALTGRFALSPDERARLDRLGNNNGKFDLGDVLAYLDRTGQKLMPPDTAAVKAVPSTPSAARTPRRTPR